MTFNKENNTRGNFSTKIGFILAASGSAVGLGNIWKFPYITGENGGGLFVLIYLACIFFVGLPILIAEIMIGRSAQTQAGGAFKKILGGSTRWSAIGILGVFTSFIILSFYAVVAGWAMDYTLKSLVGFTNQMNLATQGLSPEASSELLSSDANKRFTALYLDGWTSSFWATCFLLCCSIVVLNGINKGIEAASKILMPILLALIFGLTLYGMTLPGFTDALKFVFAPDITKLKPDGVLEALGHAFFTLSLGMGGMITYGSYQKNKDNLISQSCAIAGLDTLVALFACLMMFPIVFSFNQEPSAGPGLVFMSMPIAFASLGSFGSFLSILFFGLLTIAALTSAIALMEVAASWFIDEKNWSRKKSTWIVAGAALALGLPSAFSADPNFLMKSWEPSYGMTFFDTMDFIASNWLLPLGGFLIAIFAGWVMPERIKSAELKGTSANLITIWLFCIKFVAPVLVVLVLLQKSGLISINDLLTNI